MGSIGRRHGEINVIIPSRKEIIYCILKNPFYIILVQYNISFEKR